LEIALCAPAGGLAQRLTDRAEQICRDVTLIGGLARSYAHARQLPHPSVLLAGPHLFLPPQLRP